MERLNKLEEANKSRRVVITGGWGVSPLGNSWSEIKESFLLSRSGIERLEILEKLTSLKTKLGGLVKKTDELKIFTQKEQRGMSRSALFACYTAKKALEAAGLLNDPILNSGEVGVAYGSCLGGPNTLMDLAYAWKTDTLSGIYASSYLKVIGHCSAANISLVFGIRGRTIPTSSACTSGSQAIGFAYETIKSGKQKIMIAGGSEEFCPGLVGLFDSMYATSQKNSSPASAVAPLDVNRDGLVISEGAATLILEDYESAIARGVTPIAEIIAFATNTDGYHISKPSVSIMKKVLNQTLLEAGLKSSELSFIHAHATATKIGDQAEAEVINCVVGTKTPVTATKSFQGHALGAAGALESWYTINFLREGWIPQILNLVEPDKELAKTGLVQGQKLKVPRTYAMVNNFAFGGVNTSLIFKKL